MGAEKKWFFALFSSAILSILLVLSSFYGFTISRTFTSRIDMPTTVSSSRHDPPSFAYYISGGRGNKDQMFRLLLAVYHPRNQYLLHLGYDASQDERKLLAALIRSVPAIRAFANVNVVGKPDPVTYMGSTNIAATLHAAAALLKVDSQWSWFITLSALDYPLINQDDLAFVFSTVDRDVNFIEHTSDLGWKEYQRVQPIVVDPGIYLARRVQIFHATQRRPTPDSFRLFTGSPWVILSRSFLEVCIVGWENLPRTVLMYFNNVILAEEGYFHSVVCNIPRFSNLTVNADLRYMLWDTPPKMLPHYLNLSHFDRMLGSGAAFARPFSPDHPVLAALDQRVLGRGRDRATPGGWCTARRGWLSDPCGQWGNPASLKPGARSKNFGETVAALLDDSTSCK